MESHVLGRRFHFTPSLTSLSRKIQEILILSLICRESLLFTLSVAAAATSVSPDQEQNIGKQLGTDLSSNAQQSPTVPTNFDLRQLSVQDYKKFGYKQIEWSNGTAIHSATVKCLVQKSNETFGDYRFTLSVGDGIYIFGFIGVLIVLKSLLTKITMVENKPEDSEYVMSTCSTYATYKITLQQRTNNNNVLMTPPNSPCMVQTLSPPVTSTPVSYSGTQCYPLSNFTGGRLYYGERCLFSSPDGSTKSLV
ncbi:uncharacterized protein LOC143815074 [Ranitomeya variabilis]|uniref:uncharacterized protein LOC143815074 n=1 Tax=Ranitomeya variabilis TaxID=490064 RepID=UPI00405789C7